METVKIPPLWRFLLIPMLAPDRWVEDRPSVGTVERLELENHLLSGARVVLSDGLETAVVQQGTEARRKTTSRGSPLTVSVVSGRNTPWVREITHHGRAFAPRVDEPRADHPIISSNLLLDPTEDMAIYLNEDRPPKGATLFGNPDAVFGELSSVSADAGVGGPAAFSTHLVGEGTAAAMVSQGRTGWGLSFFTSF